MDPSGKTIHELVGKWDESVDRKIGNDNFERLWEIKDFPSSKLAFLDVGAPRHPTDVCP